MNLSAGRLRAQVLEVDTEPVPSDRPRSTLHFDTSDHALPGYYWDFPTVVSGKPLVCRGVYRLRQSGDDVDIHARLAARLATMGLDLDAYPNKRFAERGFDPEDVLSRGPIMLVGEAAGVDPVTGEGIAQAIEYGALAGRFVAEALAGARNLSEWTRFLQASRLGRDLSVRTRFVRSFFGPLRAPIEELLVSSADALIIGCRHFGALPFDFGALARLAARTGNLWLRTQLRQAISLGARPKAAPSPRRSRLHWFRSSCS
jgi:flavin-dependent dehydrogenase